jgi:hypothetical protein
MDHTISGPMASPGPDSADLAATSLAMARRFASGATLWCASPSWPSHAQHVAVEFVHPVIVGKRALPAVTVPGDRPLEGLRQLARSGDILLLISGCDEPMTLALRQRARAWGLLTVWIGSGPRPEPGAADYVLWVDDDETISAYGGRFVLVYHLLWELTHVCFEHPGLLKAGLDECDGDLCVTCSDEGRLGEIVALRADGQAQVRTPAGLEAVDTTLVDDARPGDLVLIHAGSAVTIVEGSTR